MSIEKVTKLSEISILFPTRAINVRWDSYFAENSVPVSQPEIFRRAYTGDDISEIAKEISDFVTVDYLQAVSELQVQKDYSVQLLAELQAQKDLIGQMQQQHAADLQAQKDLAAAQDAHIANLTEALAAADAELKRITQA